MSDLYEYYAVGALRSRRRPLLPVASNGLVTNCLAVVCVASCFVLASMVHAGFPPAGALMTMLIVAARLGVVVAALEAAR